MADSQKYVGIGGVDKSKRAFLKLLGLSSLTLPVITTLPVAVGSDFFCGEYCIDQYYCVRCGSCMRRCPNDAIIDESDGTYFITGDCIGSYCFEDDPYETAPCEDVCPVSAISCCGVLW